MIYKTWTNWDSPRAEGILRVGLLVALSFSTAYADEGVAKSLLPYEGTLTKSAIGLAILLCGLVAWEVVESKRASRSSLDIAKLAAAAAKKKASTSAPASGSLEAPSSRSFAPPPPPPPSTSPPPPPPPASTGAAPPPPPPMENPFAAPQSATSTPPPAAIEGPAGLPTDSTVAFNPPDAGSSGGWAHLLQRVRAGEPEAASFGGDAPPPSTEGDAQPAAFGAGDAPAFGMASSGGPADESSSSSEAWEALLKRTTNSDPAGSDLPSGNQDASRISLGSNFLDTPEEPKAEPQRQSSFQLPASPDSAPAATPFQLPGTASASHAPTTSFQLSNEPGAPSHESSSFQLPGSSGSDSPTSSFQFPSSAPEPPVSSFQLPGAAASAQPDPAPSFKLPGAAGSEFGGGGGGFQMPGAGMGSNPFGGPSDTSSTLPLSDMFSSSQSAPSFQLPSLGTQSGGSPFDFSGEGGGHDAGPGRTISLDFSQGSGQIPPPPQPKTEG